MNMEDRKKPITIYGPEADEWVPKITSLGYGKLRFPVNVRNVEYEGNQIETLFDDEEIMVQAIPAKHGVPAVAYAFIEKDRVRIDKDKARALGLPEKGRIFQKIKDDGAAAWKGKHILLQDVATIDKGKKIVYTGDTLPCANIIKLAEDADVLIHDSTFFEEDKEGEWKHAVFEDVLKVAERARAKQLILTHISRRYQNLEEIEKHIKDMPNVKLAHDFMKVVI
jgi:ribonuclease Z